MRQRLRLAASCLLIYLFFVQAASRDRLSEGGASVGGGSACSDRSPSPDDGASVLATASVASGTEGHLGDRHGGGAVLGSPWAGGGGGGGRCPPRAPCLFLDPPPPLSLLFSLFSLSLSLSSTLVHF